METYLFKIGQIDDKPPCFNRQGVTFYRSNNGKECFTEIEKANIGKRK